MPSFVDATEAAPRPAPIAVNAAMSGAPNASSAHPAAIAASPVVIARGTRAAASEPPTTATLKGAKRRPSLVSA